MRAGSVADLVEVTALLGSWTSGILVFNQRTLDEVRFWLAGSLAGRDLDAFWQVSPFLLGPALLLTADIAGRVVARPSELQVGIVTAVVGAPFLIFLARRRKLASV